MKTPLENLIEYIEEWQPENKHTNGIWSKAKQLLFEEREVIVNANRAGVDMVVDKKPFVTGEQYFENTFKTH